MLLWCCTRGCRNCETITHHTTPHHTTQHINISHDSRGTLLLPFFSLPAVVIPLQQLEEEIENVPVARPVSVADAAKEKRERSRERGCGGKIQVLAR